MSCSLRLRARASDVAPRDVSRSAAVVPRNDGGVLPIPHAAAAPGANVIAVCLVVATMPALGDACVPAIVAAARDKACGSGGVASFGDATRRGGISFSGMVQGLVAGIKARRG